MSLLQQGQVKRPAPKLDGKEVLVGPDPSICVVKGVMFGGRKQFLIDQFGEKGFYDVLSRLSPATMTYARTPLASSWCEFASLVEYDRTIHEQFSGQYPNVLELVGAASAELGIGKVYRSLDAEELLTFLAGIARVHQQYQKYGRVEFKAADEHHAKMSYFDYPCYSPIFCASANGFFLEAILRHGGTDPEVVQTKCHCRGDGVCVYEMSWK
jgi:predicted hydrocarbon binding protein